jgi:hypothetical protein
MDAEHQPVYSDPDQQPNPPQPQQAPLGGRVLSALSRHPSIVEPLTRFVVAAEADDEQGAYAAAADFLKAIAAAREQGNKSG